MDLLQNSQVSALTILMVLPLYILGLISLSSLAILLKHL